MTRDEISAMFERRLAAYGRRDAAALAADYTHDCVIDSPSGGTHDGREAAEKVLRKVFEALDLTLRRQAILIDGQSVAEVVDIEGSGVGAFLGLPPTGRSFRVPGVLLYELKDGLIARERRIYDFTSLLIQAGLLNAKPAR